MIKKNSYPKSRILTTMTGLRQHNMALFPVWVLPVQNRYMPDHACKMRPGSAADVIYQDIFLVFVFEIDKFDFDQLRSIQRLINFFNQVVSNTFLTDVCRRVQFMGQPS